MYQRADFVNNFLKTLSNNYEELNFLPDVVEHEQHNGPRSASPSAWLALIRPTAIAILSAGAKQQAGPRFRQPPTRVFLEAEVHIEAAVDLRDGRSSAIAALPLLAAGKRREHMSILVQRDPHRLAELAIRSRCSR